jgi:thiol-disulfide isomerase/thioredoxin
MSRIGTGMTEIASVEQYDDFVHRNNKCLVFYGSENCGHCQHIKPVVYQLVKQYPGIKFAHVEVTKVHVDNLDGVPIFVGFRKGTGVDKVEGADQKALMHLLDNL